MINFFVYLLLCSFVFSQEKQSINALKSILQTKEVVQYFDGIFKYLGVTIEETGESFTIHHDGNTMEFNSGINEDKVEFIVPIKEQNIENMVSHAKDGRISDQESWRILSVLFTPLTKVTLKSPVLSVNWRRKIAGIEDLTHVYLLNPSGKEANKHSLVYVKGQWLVLNGIHGEPKRTYRMSPDQALEYQKKIFSAMEKDSFIGWFKFSSWYKKWRKTCSITH